MWPSNLNRFLKKTNVQQDAPNPKMDVEQDIAPPCKNNQPSCDIAPSIET
jgi:hypothetical protein